LECRVFQTQICSIQKVFPPHAQSCCDSGPRRSALLPRTSRSDKYAPASALHALASRSYSRARAKRRVACAGPPPPPVELMAFSSFICLAMTICRQESDEPPACVVEFFIFLCVFLVLLCSLLCFFRSNLVCKSYFIPQNVCHLLDQVEVHVM
jgi:hypothetical protein